MATMTAGATYAPLIPLTPGQRFTLQATAVIAVLFWASFGYGHAERNAILDTVTAVAALWQVLTSPWLYGALGIAAVIWKNRVVLRDAHRTAGRRRAQIEAYTGAHRSRRHG